MAELVHDCPRCGARKITFSVTQHHVIKERYGYALELFCICRECLTGTIFFGRPASDAASRLLGNVATKTLPDLALGDLLKVDRYVSIADFARVSPPDHLPPDILAAFVEATKCQAIGCHNAAGAMFRLCVDIATQMLLPDPASPGGPNSKERRDLGLRLPWLFAHGRLPEDIHALAACIKDDGNDAAHRGSLKPEDADDLLDFTVALLERLYTQPGRLRLAQARRDARRAPVGTPGTE